MRRFVIGLMGLSMSFVVSAGAVSGVELASPHSLPLLEAMDIKRRIDSTTKQTLLYFRNNEKNMSDDRGRRANTRAWKRFQESRETYNAEVMSEFRALLEHRFTSAEIKTLNEMYSSELVKRFRDFMNSPESNAILAKPYERAKSMVKEELAKN